MTLTEFNEWVKKQGGNGDTKLGVNFILQDIFELGGIKSTHLVYNKETNILWIGASGHSIRNPIDLKRKGMNLAQFYEWISKQGGGPYTEICVHLEWEQDSIFNLVDGLKELYLEYVSGTNSLFIKNK